MLVIAKLAILWKIELIFIYLYMPDKLTPEQRRKCMVQEQSKEEES